MPRPGWGAVWTRSWRRTCAAWEIILVDDASADASSDIGRRYAAACPERVRFLQQPCNLGPGAARNAGLALAQGEYLGFADADDVPEPKMFSALYDAARAGHARRRLSAACRL